MKIAKHTVVELTYELEVDGQIVDRTTVERPLDFIHGTGSLLPKFEENIEGMEKGDRFTFTLTPEDGYGLVDPSRIIDLPMEIFTVEGRVQDQFLKVGAMVPLVNGQGQMVPGRVLEVGEKTVKVDLNSPMAGKTLNFTGEIVSVREATEKELTEGLHGEYVHSNCGCHGGCGGHGGSCGEGGCGGHEGGCSGHDGGCCGGHDGGCGHDHGHDDCGCGCH